MSKWLVPLAALLLAMPGMYVAALVAIRATGTVTPEGLGPLAFTPETDLAFDYETALPGHANGMVLMATDAKAT